MINHSRYIVLLVLVLLAGCRAERVVFRFQPVSTPFATLSGLPAGSRLLGRGVPQALPDDCPAGGVSIRSRTVAGGHLRRNGARGSFSAKTQTAPMAGSFTTRLPGPKRERQAGQRHPADGFTRPLWIAETLFFSGVMLGIGGVLLGAALGGLGGFLIGFAAVLFGLLCMLFSLPVAIAHDNGGPFRFNAATLAGCLLVALGLSPLLGVSLALLSVPGSAVLALGLGLFVVFLSSLKSA